MQCYSTQPTKWIECELTSCELSICCAFTNHVEDDFAYNSLKIFKGEGNDGRTGSARMLYELNENLRLIKTIDYLKWRHIVQFKYIKENNLLYC